MNDEKLTTIEQVKQFLKGSEALRFEGVSKEERYHWIESVLVRFTYRLLKRAEKRGGNPPIPAEGERIFPVTDLPADQAILPARSIEKHRLPQTPFSQALYTSRHCLVG